MPALTVGSKLYKANTPIAWDATFSNGGALALVEICSVNEWGSPSFTPTYVETTTNCSTAKEYLPGFPDPQDFTINLMYEGADNAVQGISGNGLLAWFKNPVTRATPIGYEIRRPQFGGTTPEKEQFNAVLANAQVVMSGQQSAQILQLTFRSIGLSNFVAKVP